MQKLSFVIPCYGSEHTIAAVIDEIKNTVQTRSGYTYEILLVCDGSPDAVFHVIEYLAIPDSNIHGICFTKNFGQHAALMAGYRCCTGDIIISLDDDGQTPASELFSLVDGINDGADVVYAAYEEKQHSAFRKWGSRVNDLMAEILIEKPKTIKVSSYFAMTQRICHTLTQYTGPYPYMLGLIMRSTKNVKNVAVQHRKRSEGASRYTLKKLLALWANGFTAFSVKPLRVATICGVLCAATGFAFGLWIIVHKLMNPATPAGYSSLMAVLLFIGGMLMLMLGLIGEYVGRIYISINSAPQYVIRETVNFNDPSQQQEAGGQAL